MRQPGSLTGEPWTLKEESWALEYHVDSMGLDEAWCTRSLDPTSPVWRAIVKLVRVKRAGVGDHL
jgi:hypothetical protein